MIVKRPDLNRFLQLSKISQKLQISLKQTTVKNQKHYVI